MIDRPFLVHGAFGLKRFVASAMLLTCVGAASPYSWGPQLTDDVDVSEVFDPKVESGILMIHARVTGSTVPGNEKRDYFILYMGMGQTLPAVGTRCRIDYRNGKVGDQVDAQLRPIPGYIVDRFSCSDGKHYPDGSPRYILP